MNMPCYDWIVGGSKEANVEFLKKYFSFVQDVIINDSIIYSSHPELDKYKNSHILVLGGGPSIDKFDWKSLDYDYIWSMNHFFLHQTLSKVEIDLVSICPEVNLLDVLLYQYLYKFEPLLAFEPHHSWTEPKNKELIRLFYQTKKKVAFSTHFYGKIGAGARLMVLAAALSPSKVSFLGFDGPEPILKGQHAFQPGKKVMPSQINKVNCRQVFWQQYNEFWVHIQEKFPNTHFISVDKSNIYHKMLSFNFDIGDGRQSEVRETFHKFPGKMFADEHILYSQNDKLQKFKDASVLIIGGGPSTNSFYNEWSKLKVDYKWSVNHFFKNNKMYNTKLDLVSLSTDVNLRDPLLLSYINREHPIVCLEPRCEWQKLPERTYINGIFNDINDMMYFCTAYAGKTGICPRLMILAAYLEVKKIYFIGMDGPGPMFNNQHAFLPKTLKIPGGVTPHNANRIYSASYQEFWKYIKTNWSDIEFVSLDKDNIYH